MAAPAGGGESKVQRASPVDADKLWRDRVNSELQHQRNWNSEYGFMVDETKLKLQEEAVTDLSSFKSKMSYAGLKSTAQATHAARPSPEQFKESKFNRRKFKVL